ncbi:MAG: hypothetical protein H6558_11435 [Lewinellaceae bacterium]|nr:hypothetical protein [Lewinellaceae bacterium]MCB9290893.1 hypothetical protein [Lewinellaceae bacterium]
MKIVFFTLFLAISFSWIAHGQYATVNFDYEKARFGENQPLPAETPIVFTGPIEANIDIVEVRIFAPKGKDNRAPLAVADWKRPRDKNGATNFNVLTNYKLRASKKYDIEVTYFRPATDKERQALISRLTQSIDTYLDSQMGNNSNRISFQKSAKKILRDMNQLASSVLSEYRRRSDEPFPPFSELVKMKTEQIESVNLSKAGAETDGSTPAKAGQRQKLIEELRALAAMEIEAMAGPNLLIFADSRYVEDYQTEDKAGYFAVNAGYGGVYLGGNLENLDYGTAPYLGLSFPLSTSTIAPRFLRNASITMGVFTRNFDGENNKEISGPLIGRPFYLGLDYKLFQFVRFNAGGAILEEPETTGVEDSNKRIFLQPFIGLSAKVNLSLSLDK